MWLCFDLTHGELARLCRKAEKPQYATHLRSYYGNIRKQLFDKLDWLTEKFLKSPGALDENSGWLRPSSSTESCEEDSVSPPRSPTVPNDAQLRDARLMKASTLRKTWANIDILTDEAWEDTTSNALLLTACRTATYIKYSRAASLKQGKRITIEEKTH